MGRTARALGRELGLSDRETNVLLKKHGYLEGEPGAYRLTDKGAEFGTEYDHVRGDPLSLTYGARWETRTWEDGTVEALRADIENAAAAPDLVGAWNEHDALNPGPAGTSDEDPSLAVLAVSAAALGAFIVVAPHAMRLWDKRIKPAAQTARDRVWRRRDTDMQPEPQVEDDDAGRTPPG